MLNIINLFFHPHILSSQFLLSNYLNFKQNFKKE